MHLDDWLLQFQRSLEHDWPSVKSRYSSERPIAFQKDPNCGEVRSAIGASADAHVAARGQTQDKAIEEVRR